MRDFPFVGQCFDARSCHRKQPGTFETTPLTFLLQPARREVGRTASPSRVSRRAVRDRGRPTGIESEATSFLANDRAFQRMVVPRERERNAGAWRKRVGVETTVPVESQGRACQKTTRVPGVLLRASRLPATKRLAAEGSRGTRAPAGSLPSEHSSTLSSCDRSVPYECSANISGTAGAEGRRSNLCSR